MAYQEGDAVDPGASVRSLPYIPIWDAFCKGLGNFNLILMYCAKKETK